MPKTKIKNQQKISEDELSELLQKSLKKRGAEEQENIEELENPEENIDLRALEFHQFMRPDREAGAPVLERIAGNQTPRPIFVGGIPQGPIEEERNGDNFKYVPGTANTNEPKYVESSAQIYMEPQHADSARIGRTKDVISQTTREISIQQAPELRQWGFESPASERTWAAERIDVERAGRRDPLEKEEVKYEKYRPKFPKG